MSRRARLAVRGILLLAIGAVAAVLVAATPRPQRAAPAYEPPVLAGRFLWGSCSAGFHARLGDRVVVTTSGHCAVEGMTATDGDGRALGVFGPSAAAATCAEAGHTCRPSDLSYLVIEPHRIPWGRLHWIDMGAGGYRQLAADTTALDCAAIRVGDRVEINGRDLFRAGTVVETGPYVHDPARDSDAFPCMAAARIAVATGDSGAAVLVRGQPAGVVSRSFGGVLGIGGAMGFTPLAEGLANLGLVLCTTPDCGLPPPG